MSSTVPAAPSGNATTLQSTIGAAVTALIALPLIFLVLAIAFVLVGAIVATAFDLPVPGEEQMRAWVTDGGSIYVEISLALVAALMAFLTLKVTFLLFKRANKRRTIVLFAVGYVLFEVSMMFVTGSIFLAFIKGVMLSCLAYYLHVRQQETLTPP